MLTSAARIQKDRLGYPILVISLCAAFLFYKYVLQIYPSIITNQLMQEFSLTGAGLGNLAASFYYSYMVTQLIVGVLLDKYSTRWLTSFAIFSCAASLILFARADTLTLALTSRALMGAGVAFATVAYMKLAAVWCEPKHYAFVSGLLATAAMAGAVFGQAPLSLLVDDMGWRACLDTIGVIGIIFAILFAILVRDKPKEGILRTQETPVSWQDFFSLLKSKQNWLLTLYSGLAFSPIAIFGGLWGNPFLQQAYQVDSTKAASLLSLVFIGLGLGSPLLGLLSDRLGNRRLLMIVNTIIAMITLSLVLYCHPMPLWLVSILLFTFGFSLGSFMLVFAIGKDINLPVLTATVVAMINASDALLDGITEPGIGKFLDMFWDGKIVNGVHYFSLENYHIALSVLPIYLFLAVLCLFWVKDKRCR